MKSFGVVAHPQHALALEQREPRRADRVDADDGVRSRWAASAKWRAREGLHALHEGLLRAGGDEHHAQPLERRARASARASAEQRGDAGEVVVGAGDDVAREPMSAIVAACAGDEHRARRGAAARSPSSAPRATSAGPPNAAAHRPAASVSRALEQPGEALAEERAASLGCEEQAASARRRGGRRTRPCARRPRSPASATTFQVGRLRQDGAAEPQAAAGRRRRRPPRPPQRRRRARARQPAAPRGRPAPASAVEQPERPPVGAVRALLLDARASQPSLAQLRGDPLGRLGARRRPRRRRATVDRREARELALAGSSGRSIGPRRITGAGRLPPMAPTRLHLLQDHRGRAARRRSSTRTSAPSRSWTSTRATRGHALVIPRDARRRTSTRSPTRTSAARALAAKRLAVAHARQARRRRRQPAQLLRAGRLADGLPLPRARDPALRGRPAAAARPAAGGRHGRDRRGRGELRG